MTTLMIEQLAAPSSAREARALDVSSSRAVDELGGCAVWCAAALPAGRGAAETLSASLQSSGEGVAAPWLEMEVGEPLHGLARRLDAMLAGSVASAPGLGPGEWEIHAAGTQDSEVPVGPGVAGDDVAVMHDPLTAAGPGGARARCARRLARAGGQRAAGRGRGVGVPAPRHAGDRRLRDGLLAAADGARAQRGAHRGAHALRRSDGRQRHRDDESPGCPRALPQGRPEQRAGRHRPRPPRRERGGTRRPRPAVPSR